MRSFLAIELPENVRIELASLAQDLAKSEADVKWVAQDHIHLTLRFFGEVDEAQKSSIESILENTSGSVCVFESSISRLGAFPNIKSPRVIWVGIEKGSEEISNLANKLNEDFDLAGFSPEEKSFVPHITLGRARSSKNKNALSEKLKNTAWNPPPSFFVNGLTLFQSTLTSSGPIYTRLSSWPLSKQP